MADARLNPEGFKEELVPPQWADLFHHGQPDEDGNPVGLSNDQYDALKAEYRARGEWPLDDHSDDDLRGELPPATDE